MRVVGNILWLILGGLVLAVGYLAAGVVMFVLIITIPDSRATRRSMRVQPSSASAAFLRRVP